MLAFEGRWWRHAGAKEEAIRAEFGLSATRYYQVLNSVIDSPAALAYDPMLVRRLQRMRAARLKIRPRGPVGLGDADRTVGRAPAAQQPDLADVHPAPTDLAEPTPEETE